MRTGYPNTSTRVSSLYNVRVSQPTPDNNRVIHGAGEYWFYDSFGNTTEMEFRNKFQNYISNFIRTGDPNSKFKY